MKPAKHKEQDERVIATLLKMTGDQDSVRQAVTETRAFSAPEMQKLVALLAAHRRRVSAHRNDSEKAS